MLPLIKVVFLNVGLYIIFDGISFLKFTGDAGITL